MSWDELEINPENELQCAKCGRICELELPKCPGCGTRFCDFCVYRVGGHEYCGRACGYRYHFGGGDDDDETAED